MITDMLSRSAREVYPALVAALGKFGRFKPEIEHATRKQEVKTNPILDEMLITWRKTAVSDAVYIDKYYGLMLIEIEKLEYSLKDVEAFSIAIGANQGEDWFQFKAGLFLSALVNSSPDDGFAIHTTALAEPIHYLGFHNTKKIVVDGDVGRYAGNWMKSGTLIIDGNTDFRLGWEMRGGSIVLKGDSGNEVGAWMKGGSIVVQGNASDFVGQSMQAGTITVDGHARGLGYLMRGGEIRMNGSFEFVWVNLVGGKIYHNGELIADK
jgi:hypothetical protein